MNAGTAKLPRTCLWIGRLPSLRCAMVPAEEFRRKADECKRMASSTRGDEKGTWSRMAERWLACAKHADGEYAAVRFRKSDRSKPHRRPAREWAQEPLV